MIDYRTARPEEMAEIIAFADAVFSQSEGGPLSFAAALPKVYGGRTDYARWHHVAADDALGIRAVTAILPQTLHAAGTTLKQGFLGTVSVHPDARGEGHMKHVMRDVIDDLYAEGFDLALLDGQRQRYEYFGFVPGGLRWRYELSDASVKHAMADVDIAHAVFSPLCEGTDEEAAAEALHRTRPVWVERNAPSFTEVCRSYCGRPFVMTEKGRVTGFLVAAAKDDGVLWDVCTADTAALDRLLKAWLIQHSLTALRLDLPDWTHDERMHLSSRCEYVLCCQGVQTKLLRYASAIEALLRVKSAYTPLADAEVAMDCEGQRFTVRVKDGKVQVTEGAVDPIILDQLVANRTWLSPFPCDGCVALPDGWAPLPVFACQPDEF